MSLVDDPSDPDAKFEFSCRSGLEPEVSGKTVSWGMPASNEKVLSRYKVGHSWYSFNSGLKVDILGISY